MREFFVTLYGIQPTFAEFKPHVSLSYSWNGSPALDDLELPSVPLLFDQMKVKALKSYFALPQRRKVPKC
jgi:hypothetical protein